MAHTKGPWIVTTDNKVDPLVVSPSGRRVAKILLGDFSEPIRAHWANAQLIAAAPDLLEACEAIHEWLGTDDAAQALPFEPPWYQQLRDAIAKARSK